MPKRHMVLAPEETYHIYNRSVGKEQIFTSRRHIQRMLELLDYYRYPHRTRFSQYQQLPLVSKREYEAEWKRQTPLIKLFAYTLMPNHYHLLVKQLQTNGILTFIKKIQNGFAKYHNIKSKRHGSVFQHAFAAKRIETDEEFLHIIRYIHLNPVTGYMIEFPELSSYQETSFAAYKNQNTQSLVDTSWISEHFSSMDTFVKFHEDQVGYQRALANIKHIAID